MSSIEIDTILNHTRIKASEKSHMRDSVMNDILSGKIRQKEVGDIPLQYLDINNLPGVPTSNIMTESTVYKPFRYEFGYKMWEKQNQLQWLPEEVPMSDDMRDWKSKLSDNERSLLSNVFPLFVQSDLLIQNAYIAHYARIFKPNEIQMGISSIANMESTHQAAYAHLLDSLSFPVETYSEFLAHQAMVDKIDYTAGFRMDTLTGIAVAMVVFGCLTEGLQLFATFALLMNFPRQNKLKGMGQIVSWSVRDESLHVGFVSQLFKVFLSEFGHLIDQERLLEAVDRVSKQMVKNEYGYCELAFRGGPITGVSYEQHIDFIDSIADMRLKMFGFKSRFGDKENPYDWYDSMIGGVELANFFESRSTSYTRAATTGTWEEAWQ